MSGILTIALQALLVGAAVAAVAYTIWDWLSWPSWPEGT